MNVEKQGSYENYAFYLEVNRCVEVDQRRKELFFKSVLGAETKVNLVKESEEWIDMLLY